MCDKEQESYDFFHFFQNHKICFWEKASRSLSACPDEVFCPIFLRFNILRHLHAINKHKKGELVWNISTGVTVQYSTCNYRSSAYKLELRIINTAYRCKKELYHHTHYYCIYVCSIWVDPRLFEHLDLICLERKTHIGQYKLSVQDVCRLIPI